MASGRLRNGKQIKTPEGGRRDNKAVLRDDGSPRDKKADARDPRAGPPYDKAGRTSQSSKLELDRGQRTGKPSLLGAALKLLAVRSRSEADLRAKLFEKQPGDSRAIDACMTRLKEMGLVDDLRFAESYTRSRIAIKAVGRTRLARELAARRVDRETIRKALDLVFEQEGEDELIDRAIRKHVRMHGRPNDRAAAKKLFSHLARLGFEFDLIRRKMKSISNSESDDAGSDDGQ